MWKGKVRWSPVAYFSIYRCIGISFYVHIFSLSIYSLLYPAFRPSTASHSMPMRTCSPVTSGPPQTSGRESLVVRVQTGRPPLLPSIILCSCTGGDEHKQISQGALRRVSGQRGTIWLGCDVGRRCRLTIR